MANPEMVRPWPDVMTAKLAAQYCDLTVSALNMAVVAGTLHPAGRRGGNGARTFDKAALDRWMRGQAP